MRFRSFPKVSLSCLLLLAAVGAGCRSGDQQTATPPRLSVDFLTEVKLGGDPEGPPAALLGHPRFVRTDRRGRIYVADVAAMMIRVYDPSGTFVRTIGGRGRGPGLFHDITCMHVDRQDELIVVDGLREIITRFSTSGEVLATDPLDTGAMLWPRDLRDPDPEQYLFLYKMPDPRSKGIFHLFDRRLHKLGSFGKWTRLGFRNDTLHDHLVQVRPGSVGVRRNGTVLYAPWPYRGTIYEFAEQDGEWERTTKLRGYVARAEPFTSVALEEYDRSELSASIKTRRGDWGVIFHNESRGLFELADGRLVHFTAIEVDGQRVFGVELYAADGELIGYAPYESAPLKERGATFVPLTVDWKDADDRFFLRRRGEIPEIRVVRLRFGEAGQAGA